MANHSLIAALSLTGGAIAAAGCPRAHPPAAAGVTTAPAAEIRTDSTQYTVRFTGLWYRAAIGYAFTNRTGAPVSANYCRTPAPPSLEKDAGGGRWVPAYHPIEMLCKTGPPFRVAAGVTYRGTLDLWAARRGANTAPELEVDSIPGTYRLRWVLRAGPDPDDQRAPDVVAVSAPFRLVEQR